MKDCSHSKLRIQKPQNVSRIDAPLLRSERTHLNRFQVRSTRPREFALARLTRNNQHRHLRCSEDRSAQVELSRSSDDNSKWMRRLAQHICSPIDVHFFRVWINEFRDPKMFGADFIDRPRTDD